MTSTPRWIDKEALILLHAESLAEHGGLEGLRDEGLFDSALARPLNIHAYEEMTDIARLAAAYGFGIAKNHPFVDGNKRAAFLAVGLFLGLNGQRLAADKADATRAMLAVAAGELSESDFAEWIKAHMKRRA
jgi:death-on-curing protein